MMRYLKGLRGGALLLHISFLLIIAGGMLTWLTGVKGEVRISPGERVESFRSDDGTRHYFDSAITLERFEVMYYPGGTIPRDYVSHLRIGDKLIDVSMNKIAEVGLTRLCQASYDSTGATVLSVNHDPYGIAVTYAGYLLFAVGGFLMLLSPKGRFRHLLRSLAVMGVVTMGVATDMEAATIAGVPREAADSLRSRQVLYGGHVVTFNTLSRDVVTKLHGKPSFRGLTSEQTLLSIALYPDQWKSQPLLKIKDKELCRILGVKGGYAALTDLFDSVGRYRLEPLYATVDSRHRHALEELDEKVGIILMLYSGELILNPSPDDTLLPAWRVNLELLYNALPLQKICFILLFCAAAVSLIAMGGVGRLRRFGLGLAWMAVIIQVLLLGMEWIMGGHLPLSNMGETLQFLSLVTVILALLLARRFPLLLPSSLMLAGAMALVAWLVSVNPLVTPLMPVLHSPWLSMHVTLVMTSYALLAFTFLIGIGGLCRPANAERLRKLSLTLLYPGEWLLGLGICTGAVWANVSWGQYWSWDPKETWALITFIIYALPFHRAFGLLRTPRLYHLYMLIAILSVAMTYWGVNLLDSRHAYT